MKIKKLLSGFLSARFRKDLSMFKRQMGEGVADPVPIGKMYPIMDDAKKESGIGDKIYFFRICMSPKKSLMHGLLVMSILVHASMG